MRTRISGKAAWLAALVVLLAISGCKHPVGSGARAASVHTSAAGAADGHIVGVDNNDSSGTVFDAHVVFNERHGADDRFRRGHGRARRHEQRFARGIDNLHDHGHGPWWQRQCQRARDGHSASAAGTGA